MRRAALAKQLIDAADDAERKRVIDHHRRHADEALAAELRKACYAAWTVEPVRTQLAAAAARVLAQVNGSAEIKATAHWTRGIAEITKGRFAAAIRSLDEAAQLLEDAADAAEVQVAKLLALAMLGRYDEALAVGSRALRTIARTGGDVAAGKLEMNLSNVVSRRGRYREAEKYGLSALRRFERAGEGTWQAMAENSLANTYTDLHNIARAEEYYRRALASAHRLKMLVTEAEIEASLGNLATFRGRYAEALRYLERSRQRYDELGMPHQSAIADLEIADIYLELGLLTEAVEIYSRVAEVFSTLKMRAEEARTRLHHGRASARLGDVKTARRELGQARRLFTSEKNLPGQASAMLSQAELALAAGRSGRSLDVLNAASQLIRKHGDTRQFVRLGVLEGQALLAAGRIREADHKLRSAAAAARKHDQFGALQSAYEALGRLTWSQGDPLTAGRFFSKSIDVVEHLRTHVGSNEFGMALFGTRLAPYEQLSRLQLAERKFADAFATIERGRSRALLEAMSARRTRARIPDKLERRSAELRAELNSRYKAFERSGEDSERLRSDIVRTEAELATVNRQIASLTAGGSGTAAYSFGLAELIPALDDRTLVEFVEIDDQLSAFVVDKNGHRYVGLGSIAKVRHLLEELHFQFGTLRYGGSLSRFAEQLRSRADAVLRRLYDILIRPLGDGLAPKIVIVPVGALHYVPFAALFDGEQYLVERFEIASAPSAAVWRELRRRRRGKFRTSLLMAHADERIPLVENEVRELARTAPRPTVLTGDEAKFAAFLSEAGRHDLIHLACHGQFRPDSPMFSSLHLADGWITVQDLTSRPLRAQLVTLSACETGLSTIFAGDELLGLARGFLAAGANSLVVSLWPVNDEAASRLMQQFYLSLQRGRSGAASLQDAQNAFITDGAHPYLWSPFVYIGQ